MPSIYLAPEIRRLCLASQGWRGLVALLALTLGVGLGYGVHGVHAVAVAETESAARRLAGEADLIIQSVQGQGVDEALYASIAARPEVAVASPVVEVEAKVPAKAGDRRDRLRILGMDIFRAGELQPALARLPDPGEVLVPDRIFINPAAAAWLGVAKGDTIQLQSGVGEVSLQVAGIVDLPGQPVGAMDIAGAQVAFGSLGHLSRIDLRLQPGVDGGRARAEISSLLPSSVRAELPGSRVQQAAEFTRSYRVNLDMLALVALFTGGLLVFSSQALAVVRRRRHLGLLRTLGVTRRELLVLLLTEAALLGLIGSACGIGLGQILARLLLKIVGADLGGAYFQGLAPRAGVDGMVVAVFLGLGMAAALVGSLLPILEATRASPAKALHAGDEDEMFARRCSPRPGLALLAAALVMTALPPAAGLPVFGYGAIALFLLGAIGLLPWVTGQLLALVARLPLLKFPSAFLAIFQLRRAAGQSALTLAPLVASVAVAAAMAIMVGSFRHSLEAWLERLLPAHLYLRAGAAGDSSFLPLEAQSRLAALPGVARVEFRRSLPLALAADKPPVILMARTIDPRAPDQALPLVGSWLQPKSGESGVWISEVMGDLYGWQIGQTVSFPLGKAQFSGVVLGLWRDYARSGGAVILERETYRALTGDGAANEAALWLSPGTPAADVEQAINALFPAGTLEVESPEKLKELSLALFDRTFAATYALEGVAVALGLAGLSASFAALVLARRREFGVLRHLGMERRQVAAMLACQGAVLAGVALLMGLVLGGVLSVVLIHVVNRQSFHWTMDVLVPWGPLTLFSTVVAILAMVTAASSGRFAMEREAAMAVREDW